MTRESFRETLQRMGLWRRPERAPPTEPCSDYTEDMRPRPSERGRRG